MIDACREAGLPAPAWQADDDGVTLTLYSLASMDAPAANLGERQMALIHTMEPGNGIRLSEYRERFASKVTTRQAQRDLRELQEADLLRLEGKGRSAHYVRTARRLP